MFIYQRVNALFFEFLISSAPAGVWYVPKATWWRLDGPSFPIVESLWLRCLRNALWEWRNDQHWKKTKGFPPCSPTSWFHHVSPGFLWDSRDISMDVSLRFRSLKFCSQMSSPCWYHQCIDFLREAKLQAPCNAFLVDDQPLKSAPKNIYQDWQNSIFGKQKTWCFPTLFNMLSPVFNCFAPKLPSGNLT